MEKTQHLDCTSIVEGIKMLVMKPALTKPLLHHKGHLFSHLRAPGEGQQVHALILGHSCAAGEQTQSRKQRNPATGASDSA